MFDRILVPLDGSSLAERALGWAVHLAGPGGRLFLARACGSAHGPSSDYWSADEKPRREAEDYLEGVAKRVDAQGARAQSLVRPGAAADVILDLAAEHRASLIVMSTHGRTGFARWAFGSVAEKILRASVTPVFVVRSFPGRPEAPGLPHCRNILLPVDGSNLSRSVVPHVAELARRYGAQVSVLMVPGPGDDPPAAKAFIDAVVGSLAVEGVPAQGHVREGDPAAAILDACVALRADLLAMASHGRTGPSRWVLGSVTEKVLRTAGIPLLLERGQAVARTLEQATEASWKE
jgi:nucleotide-binding universal stress UspA family protein